VSAQVNDLSGTSSVGVLTLNGDSIVENSVFGQNLLESTSSVYVMQSLGDTTLENVVFSSNGLQAGGAATVYQALGPTEIVNTTFQSHVGAGVPYVIADFALSGTVNNTIFAEDVADASLRVTSSVSITYTDIFGASDPVWDVTNLPIPWLGMVEDPLFLTPGYAELQSLSPLLDVGDPTLFDRDGSRSDLGATGGPDGLDSAG
jgi:hypothetical protein